ncbi:MAG: isoprenylcysteine carboxylmethyltransferase family protein [Acidobacteriota bacterium]
MVYLFGLDTRILFTGLVALVAVQRLVELRVARRNERRKRAAGGVEAGAGHYPVMVGLHTLFLLSCVAEVWLLPRPFVPWLGFVMLVVLAAASGLRWWVVRSLGGAWTTRVIVVPGAPLVASGPYRFFAHPNYVAVALEIAALPMVHTAYLTAGAFSLANGALLAVRIRTEEAALERHGGKGESR